MSFTAPLLDARQDWYCPNCTVTATSRPSANGGLLHVCAGLHMLSAPLIRAGVRCQVTAAVREDYLNGDVQATGDDGKPYMNVRTTYDDHDDLLVNAGLATGRLMT